MTYETRTDEELKKLAQDFVDKKVFTNLHLDPKDLDALRKSFMVLAFMKEDQYKDLDKYDIICFYEYIDKALPRSIDGNPIFSTVNYLDQTDANKFCEYVDELQEAAPVKK